MKAAPMNTKRILRNLGLCGVVGGLLLTGSLPAHAVPPTPPTYILDDAGDVAFVRNATRALLARQPKGSVEVELLVDIAATLGRGAVVDLLMALPEFERYWMLVLADDLKVDRDPDSRLAKSDCYTEPKGSTLADTALIDHVLTQPPTDVYGGALPVTFNMTDVLRSTIAADRMMPLYKLAMMPMAVAELDPDERRDKFMDVFINREGGCLDCHTSIYSRTDEWSGFDRFAPPPFALEHSVFPQSAAACVTDTWGALGNVADGAIVYDNNCAWCHDEERASGAWSLPIYAPPHAERVPSLNNDQLAAGITLMETVAGVTLTDLERDNVMAFMRDTYGEPACLDWRSGSAFFDVAEACPTPAFCSPSSPAQPWGLDTTCGHFGSTAAAPPVGAEWMGATAMSMWGLSESLGAADLAEVYDVRDCTGGAVDCVDDTLPIAFAPGLSGPTAFGYMVGYRIVENIVHEVSGAELSIANRFARVDDANLVVRNLAEEHFLPNGLSLKKLLRSLVLSPVFNRHAPKETTLADAYQLPMVLNPWVLEDGIATGDGLDANSQGDFVHRHSVDNLLLAVHHALGWTAPKLLPDETEYPSLDFVRGLGQRIDSDTPGFDDLTFQALYEWENVVGLCEKPPLVTSDWIDELATAVTTESVEDVLVAVKDRLLQERVNNGELLEIEAFFGISRSDAATLDLLTGDEHMLRHYCGVLMSTPQFMLAGVTRDLATPAPGPVPALGVCLPGETCTALPLCLEYVGELATLGYVYGPC
jgi:hypothetical protein